MDDPNITNDPEEIALRRCWAAQPVLESVVDPELAQLISFLAAKKGFPSLFMVGNLLSSTLHFMGKAKVMIMDNDDPNMAWKEPLVAFVMVVAGCGTNKSAATKDVLAAVKMVSNIKQEENKKKNVSSHIKVGIEEAINASQAVLASQEDTHDEQENEAAHSKGPPNKKQKVVDVDKDETEIKSYVLSTTPESLRDKLCAGDGDLIMINEECDGFLTKLMTHKTSSGSSKDDFGCYFGASEISHSSIKGGDIGQKDPRMNLIGFVQPMALLTVMEKKEQVGFWHRWIFLCPERVVRRYKTMRELQKPTDKLLDLNQLLIRIFYIHTKPRTYRLLPEAVQKLDELEENYQKKSEDNPTSSELSGKASKGLTNIIRIATANACLRNAMKAQKNDKNVTVTERYSELKPNAPFEKKQECSETGMDFTIESEDVEKAYTLIKFSDVCYETFRDVATEAETNVRSGKSGSSKPVATKTTAPKKTLDNPEDETSDYIFKNKVYIQRIYREIDSDNDGKSKFSNMSTKKLFPNPSVSGNKTAKDKLQYFAKVLNKHEIIETVDSAYFKKKTPDDWENLSDDGKKIFVGLYKLSKSDKDVFDPFGKKEEFDADDD